MTSKRGVVPGFLIFLIIGIFIIFILYPLLSKSIPRTFQDAQAVEHEVRAFLNNSFNPSPQQLTKEDVAFLRSYNSFVQALQACLRTATSDCLCKTSLPAPTPLSYKILFTRDPKIGAFSYPLASNSRSPLDTLTALTPPQEHMPKGYCFANSLQDQLSFTSRFVIFFEAYKSTVFSPPEQDVPSSKKQVPTDLLGLRTKDVYLYTYPAGTPLYFYKPPAQGSAHDLCLINPDPAIVDTYAQKKLCQTGAPALSP